MCSKILAHCMTYTLPLQNDIRAIDRMQLPSDGLDAMTTRIRHVLQGDFGAGGNCEVLLARVRKQLKDPRMQT